MLKNIGFIVLPFFTMVIKWGYQELREFNWYWFYVFTANTSYPQCSRILYDKDS